MNHAWEAWLAWTLGLALAGLVLAAVAGLLRLLRGLRRLLRPSTGRGRLSLSRLRGLRLRSMRARARAADGRAAEATAEIRRLRRELRLVAAERDAARARLEEARRRSGARPLPDDRFRQAKRAFARLFHPDQARGDTRERHLRTRMFNEYWQELRRIERQG